MHKLLFLLLISAFSAQGALAQNASAPTLSGGVGLESMAELGAQQASFNLKFVFTLMEGDYVADVAVRIADPSGSVVLDQSADGPILMVRLPAGNYVATLTYEGVAQTRKLAVREKGLRTEQIRWKRSEADGPAML